MKKVLSSVILVICLLVYTAPIGLCVSGFPIIDARINKPILRDTAKTSSLKLEGDISITKGNQKINLSLRDSDVKQVLRMLADKAGLNIIFHSSVVGGISTSTSSSTSSSSGISGSFSSNSSNTSSSSTAGNITMDLVNVPLNDAFKLVMQVTGLTYFMDKNTMIVTSAEAAKTLNMAKQEISVIPVKYINALELANFLNKNIFSINKPGLSNGNIAIINPGENEILIFGTENDAKMARKIVAQFDVKPREESFVVNHTTPAEMAKAVCQTLIGKDFGNSGSSSSDGSSTGGAASASGSGLTLGGQTIACTVETSLSSNNLESMKMKNMIISYSPQRGILNVIGGSIQQLEMIRDFIMKNDKKQPQAYLELSIIELNETGSREFSNNWQVWSKYFSGNFDGTSTKTNPLYPQFLSEGQAYNVIDPADPKTVKYTLSQYSGVPTITYSMNYLISNGKGRVLANPRIMITNGETSTIDLSSDYVKSVTSQVLATGGLAGAVQKTYEIGSDEGIKVSIVPFISPDGYVTLNINPTYSTIKEKVYTPSTTGTGTDLAATLLQRRNLDLKNVRIKDGETLVIGGMIRENETKTVSKIPVLGDLPGVGLFFRNSASSKEKQELVIMLTPKIIKDSEDLVKNTDVTL
ncbi:MAG: hypothetical protein WCG95_00355 [bacterium]